MGRFSGRAGPPRVRDQNVINLTIVFTMSEQENSRSPQSSNPPAEAAAGKTEEEQQPGVEACGAGESSGTRPDTGMGNDASSAADKCIDEAVCSEEGKEESSGSEAEGQAKAGVCDETHRGLPCPREVMLLDLKEREVPGVNVDFGGASPSDKGPCEGQQGKNKAGAEKSVGASYEQGCESQAGGSGDCANNYDNGCKDKAESPASHSQEKDPSDPSRVAGSEAVTDHGDSGAQRPTTEGVSQTVGSNTTEDTPTLATLDNALVSVPAQNNTAGVGGNGPRELEAAAMHPARDTDSEAGDSVCSEEGDHGEVCRGGGGCPHQEAEEGWEYVVDEEFNVPRRPVFNGATDHLERRSSLKRRASEEAEDARPAKCRRGIQFEGVTVFYFPRSQGFTCVPSQGGSSLGMSRRHSHIRQFSLAEHAVEQRRAHREQLMRLRQQRSAREHGESSSRGSSSEDSEENSEEASDLSDSELDADSYYFLQPLPIRQRRTLLRQAGICRIEGVEKEECKDIRISREMCGCACKVYCDPDTCQCCQAGIKCQVDRHNFPCGCSREGCGNTYGRIEFNPIRVRTHFIHTLMRLEIEKRQTQQQHQQHDHQQHQQQQQEWQQQQQQHQHQQQQRAKWLASSSVPTNGFVGGGGGGGLGSGNLPFFEGGREAGTLAVADVSKFNSSVEVNPSSPDPPGLFSRCIVS
ncbi:Cysteine/serine-rich nuclear protein 2 [Chionoecetes opilio]|uniref:Cysteine/serine-rich nuclear protein 2 n=1 Tax=Chionoecetes opilio TaxID=41210 RepID=A0A8J4YC75_CHIOP|nr:Cysteine/serine-rich nuclear protein 2 [Chionoecetes opilio]